MTTLEVAVAASSDDCDVYWNGSAWAIEALTSTVIFPGYYLSTWFKNGGGMRFQNVTVPAGATVTAAYLKLKAYGDSGGTTVNTRICGHKNNDSSAFSTLADYQARRGTSVGGANNDNRTTAIVDWNNVGTWANNTVYNSPSIVSVIQEIIDLVGWASGNALSLFWDDHDGRTTASDNVYRQAYTYDFGDGSNAPILHIEYTYTPPAEEHRDVYDGTWQGQKIVSLASTGTALSAHQTTGLTLNYGSGTDSSTNLYFATKCSWYFDDIRVLDANGDALPFALYDVAPGETAKLAVKATVPASGALPITIKYNNIQAPRKADMASTFEESLSNTWLANVGGTTYYDSWPSIVRLHTGALVMSYRSGAAAHTWDNNGYVKLVTSTDGGRTWAALSTIGEADTSHDYTGCLVEYQHSGTWRLLCTYHKLTAPSEYANWKTVSVHSRYSTDGGATWTDEATIESAAISGSTYVQGIFGNAIQLSNGDILMTAFGAYDTGATVLLNSIYAYRSTDGGATWGSPIQVYLPEGGEPTKNWCSESSLIEIKNGGSYNGYVYCLIRMDEDIYFGRCLSTDYGATWGALADSGLPHPNLAGPAQLIRLADDSIVTVFSTARGATDTAGAVGMTALKAASEDADLTWPTPYTSPPNTQPGAIVYQYASATFSDSGYAWPVEMEDDGGLAVAFYNQNAAGKSTIRLYYLERGELATPILNQASGCAVDAHDGSYYFNHASGATHNNTKAINPTPALYLVEAKVKTIGTAGADRLNPIYYDGSFSHYFAELHIPDAADETDVQYYVDPAYADLYGTFAVDTYYVYQVRINESDSSTGVAYYLYNADKSSLLASATGKAFAYGTPTDMDAYAFSGGFAVAMQAYVDYHFIRKAAAAEPAFGVSMSGQSDGTSSCAGDIGVEQSLTGSSEGTSTVTGAMPVSLALDGESIGTSSVDNGALQLNLALDGQSDGAATLDTGALSVHHPLTGQSDGLSTVTGVFAVIHRMTGQVNPWSIVSGAMRLAARMTGQSDGESLVDADVLRVTSPAMTGTIVGTSAASGDMVVQHALTGTATGLAVVTGDMTTVVVSQHALTGVSVGTSGAQGAMVVHWLLTGTSAGLAIVIGNMLSQSPRPQTLAALTVLIMSAQRRVRRTDPRADVEIERDHRRVVLK